MARKRKQRIPKDPVNATITAMSHDGRGVTQIEGKTVFISGALPAEEVTFTYKQLHSRHDEGLVETVIKPSPDRVTPQCKHFGTCGGCSLQHLAPEKQIQYKQETLLEQFKHFANTIPETVLAPVTADVWAYRRKARLGVRFVPKKEKVLVGFREKYAGRFITDVEQCAVLHAAVGLKITELSEFLATLSIKEYIPQIEVAIADNANALIIRHLEPFSQDDRVALAAFANKHNFRFYLQSGGYDTVTPLDESLDCALLTYDLPDYDLQLSYHPQDFTQVNSQINQQMIKLAIEHLEIKPEDTILDLFCGLGNFSLPLARFAKSVIGVEGDDAMVKRATENAKNNNIHTAQFYSADLTTVSDSAPWLKQQYAKILLDPPRSGALEIIRLIAPLGAEKIVYISCNPATLARDTGELEKHGYRLTHAGVLDMFPHTAHVESIAVFRKV